VEAFNGNRGNHLTFLEVRERCSAVWRFREVGRVGLLEASEEINLREGELDS
jgi:hypothetical protein